MGRLSFWHDDSVKSFFRILAWIILPFTVALSGLVLLTSLWTSFIWVGIIVSIAYAYLRFNDKHGAHEEYDDHASQEKYREGLQTYIDLVRVDQAKDE